jgi:hypothetical protein
MQQSLGPTKPKWGRPAPPPWLAGQVLVPFQFLLYQHVKEGRCTGYPMPKISGGRVGWPTGWPGFGELPPQINGGDHSLHL